MRAFVISSASKIQDKRSGTLSMFTIVITCVTCCAGYHDSAGAGGKEPAGTACGTSGNYDGLV
ncbi:hypothetical protein DCT98_23815 [Salmonella enterica]|nr:hypothetical protein [Salmonella enterica]